MLDVVSPLLNVPGHHRVGNFKGCHVTCFMFIQPHLGCLIPFIYDIFSLHTIPGEVLHKCDHIMKHREGISRILASTYTATSGFNMLWVGSQASRSLTCTLREDRSCILEEPPGIAVQDSNSVTFWLKHCISDSRSAYAPKGWAIDAWLDTRWFRRPYWSFRILTTWATSFRPLLKSDTKLSTISDRAWSPFWADSLGCIWWSSSTWREAEMFPTASLRNKMLSQAIMQLSLKGALVQTPKWAST